MPEGRRRGGVVLAKESLELAEGGELQERIWRKQEMRRWKEEHLASAGIVRVWEFEYVSRREDLTQQISFNDCSAVFAVIG